MRRKFEHRSKSWRADREALREADRCARSRVGHAPRRATIAQSRRRGAIRTTCLRVDESPAYLDPRTSLRDVDCAMLLTRRAFSTSFVMREHVCDAHAS
jgi:hypothetical protein